MIQRRLRSAVRAHGLRERFVWVAVSGGVDSCVLLHGLHGLGGLRLGVGHVNHGLRGAEAEQDEAFVRELAARHGLPFRATRVDPRALRDGGSSRSRPTLQEAARRARYDALAAQARELGADCIATAHTADDQAETVLLRLLRGAGPDGLAGIPEQSADGRCVRPLLAASRAEVLAYAREQGLAWREDPSNRDPGFARARLRQRWLPGLAEDFNPRLLRAIADLAEAHRRDAEWIEDLVVDEAEQRFIWEAGGLTIQRGGWQQVPEALGRRLARHALRLCGAARDVSRSHIRRTLGFWIAPRTGSLLELPGGLAMRCEPDRFRLEAVGRSPLPGPTACYLRKSSQEPGRERRLGGHEGSRPAAVSPGDATDREPATTSDGAQETA